MSAIVTELTVCPRELERRIVLRDGARVRIRPIRPEDAERLIQLYDRLSLDTRYHRFFSAMRRLPPDWARFLATVDYERRLALVAELDAPGTSDVIGVARYDREKSGDAVEVAFVVDDRWQNRGLGTVLFTELLRAAAARSIRRFRADVLADNTRMLDLIARFTHIEQRRIDSGVVDLTFTAAEAPDDSREMPAAKAP